MGAVVIDAVVIGAGVADATPLGAVALGERASGAVVARAIGVGAVVKGERAVGAAVAGAIGVGAAVAAAIGAEAVEVQGASAATVSSLLAEPALFGCHFFRSAVEAAAAIGAGAAERLTGTVTPTGKIVAGTTSTTTVGVAAAIAGDETT